MPAIYHAILINADSEKVFDAITTREGLSGWWTRKAEAVAELHAIIRFTFGDDYVKEMKVTGLKPYERVEWDCITGADEWVGTNLSFELIPGSKASLLQDYPEMHGQVEQLAKDDATLLLFRHENWRGETLMFAECNYTWARFLRSLKSYCEGAPGMPWPEQHR